jgi:hypothetical protein
MEGALYLIETVLASTVCDVSAGGLSNGFLVCAGALVNMPKPTHTAHPIRNNAEFIFESPRQKIAG